MRTINTIPIVAVAVLTASALGYPLVQAADSRLPPAAPGAPQSLPAGPGKEATERLCSGCHDLTFTISTRETEDDWVRIVNDMRSRGIDGTDEDFDLVIAYLVAHMGKGASTSPVRHADVSLLCDRTKVAPGERFTLGLRVEAEAGWLLKEAEAPGRLPHVRWTTPVNVSVGSPQSSAASPAQMLIFFPATVSPATVSGSTLELRALVSYQMCQDRNHDTCVAETTTVSATVPIGPGGVPTHIEEFAPARSVQGH